MEERTLALGELAWDTLQRIVRELLARKAGSHLVEGRIDEIDLQVALALRGSQARPDVFARRLVEAIDARLEEHVREAAAFLPGHAFCHRCAGGACEHSQPPSCRHVFAGYSPTGTPRWEDFAQHCLERRHPRVDQLYADPPAFVTLVQDAGTLRGSLLPAFEAANHELLGQLMAGFYGVRTRAEEGRGVLALTFQVVASRGGRVGRRPGLNILGRAPGGGDLGLLWDRHGDLPWRRAVRWAQSALGSIGGRRGKPRPPESADLEQRVEAILGGMARRLERDQRARGRRTGHAQERHDAGDRPTRMAVSDIRTARSAAVMVDERSDTLVVLGERGRTHFFTREGRLVSSVRYSREAIERKRKLGLWREASREESAEIKDKLLGEG